MHIKWTVGLNKKEKDSIPFIKIVTENIKYLLVGDIFASYYQNLINNIINRRPN